jgi:hypothetical protein
LFLIDREGQRATLVKKRCQMAMKITIMDNNKGRLNDAEALTYIETLAGNWESYERRVAVAFEKMLGPNDPQQSGPKANPDPQPKP